MTTPPNKVNCKYFKHSCIATKTTFLFWRLNSSVWPSTIPSVGDRAHFWIIDKHPLRLCLASFSLLLRFTFYWQLAKYWTFTCKSRYFHRDKCKYVFTHVCVWGLILFANTLILIAHKIFPLLAFVQFVFTFHKKYKKSSIPW